MFIYFDVFRDHEVQGGVLTIPSLSQEDVGEYICTAQNRFGTAQATVQLDIGGKNICIVWGFGDSLLNILSFIYDGVHMPFGIKEVHIPMCLTLNMQLLQSRH